MFIQQYLELLRGLEIYSGVAGLLITMLILEMYAILFVVVSHWFIYSGQSLSAARYTRRSLFIVTSVLIIALLIAAGHYMEKKVSYHMQSLI